MFSTAVKRFPFNRLVLAYSEDEKINAFQSLHSLYSKSSGVEIKVSFWLSIVFSSNHSYATLKTIARLII